MIPLIFPKVPQSSHSPESLGFPRIPPPSPWTPFQVHQQRLSHCAWGWCVQWLRIIPHNKKSWDKKPPEHIYWGLKTWKPSFFHGFLVWLREDSIWPGFYSSTWKKRGAKRFRYRMSIHHPLGFNWHPDWKVQEEIGFLYNFCWVNEDKLMIQWFTLMQNGCFWGDLWTQENKPSRNMTASLNQPKQNRRNFCWRNFCWVKKQRMWWSLGGYSCCWWLKAYIIYGCKRFCQEWTTPPGSLTARPWKMVVGRLLSSWEGNFSVAMLNFRGVNMTNRLICILSGAKNDTSAIYSISTTTDMFSHL